MIYQHPLAYLLGLQGVALLRAYNGEYDREFTEARIAEIRAMLDSTRRTPPQPGQWSQLEAIWQRAH